MGPRSVERGNLFDVPTLVKVRIASMGPRSVERGNHAISRLFASAVPCFNGAAFC